MTNSRGRFYGIGVGPGDSDLLTIKVVKALKRLDVLYVPIAKDDQPSLAESIAQPYLPMGITIKQRLFPMTRNRDRRTAALTVIADEMVLDIDAGANVGMLTLGDPAVYSTVSYIVTLLNERVPVTLMAGVASYSQLAATVGQPLMCDEESLCIMPATAGFPKLKQAILQHDNIVIMKIKVAFADVYTFLSQLNLLDHAVLVTNVSLADQSIQRLTDMTGTEELTYFTTLLIKKDVAS
ncbi:precorrin-2 C(20)-methyltransferase [Furfurilactobacillus sp. WILCCON 0119]